MRSFSPKSLTAIRGMQAPQRLEKKDGLGRPFCLSLFLTLLLGSLAHGQSNVYRCGNEYTNQVSSDTAATCKLVSAASVTVIPAPQSVRTLAAAVPATATSQEQKKKDADARWILETELKKLEVRQADLQTEYNHGAPEKQGAESRNYQKYVDRIAQLKDSLSRNAEDIAGLRRELERLSVNR
jgi:hypothetical protein